MNIFYALALAVVAALILTFIFAVYDEKLTHAGRFLITIVVAAVVLVTLFSLNVS